MARSKQPPISHDIEIDDEGTPFRGWYTVESGVVKVSTALHGSEATQLGSMTPQGLARILLRELLVKSKSK